MQDPPPSFQQVMSLGDAQFPVLKCVKKCIATATSAVHAQAPIGIHGMDFDPYLVQRALGMHNGDEERAIDALLSGRVPDDRKLGAQGQHQQQNHNQHQPATIHSMGFDPRLVARALQQFRGDEQQAIDAIVTDRISMDDAPAAHHVTQPALAAPPHDLQLAEARLQLLGLQQVGELRANIYSLLPAAARKAGWGTERIQAALDLPSLGFSEGSPGERGAKLFDAIAGGRLSLHQLQQAETAALEAAMQ